MLKNSLTKLLSCLLALSLLLGGGSLAALAEGNNQYETDGQNDTAENVVLDPQLFEGEDIESAIYATNSLYDGFQSSPPTRGLEIRDTFELAGNTQILAGNEHIAVLTQDEEYKHGAIWGKEKLDLRLPFSIEVEVYLGHAEGREDLGLGDGITFTMHNDSAGTRALQGRGEGLAVYKGRKPGNSAAEQQDGTYLRNALVLEFDTYANWGDENDGGFGHVDDPADSRGSASAHCSFIRPYYDYIRVRDHQNTQFFYPKDEWVTLKVEWTPTSGVAKQGGTLEYLLVGDDPVSDVPVSDSYTVNDVYEVFGDTEVYWGFTGATGVYTALQAVSLKKAPEQGLEAKKDVHDSGGTSIDGESAKIWDTLTYIIEVSALDFDSEIDFVSVQDTLSPYVQFSGDTVTVYKELDGTPGTPSTITPSISGSVMTIDTGLSLGSATDKIIVTFDVYVKESGAGQLVSNKAIVSAQNLDKSYDSNTTEVNIAADAFKIIDDASEAGTNGKPVAPGDVITYRIGYMNSRDTTETLTITDELDDALTYISSSAGGSYNDTTRKVTWDLSVPPRTNGFVTLKVKVNSKAEREINNKALLDWGGLPDEVPEVTVPVKSYKVVDDGSAVGKDGEPVDVGDQITFKIFYHNTTGVTSNLTITDKLPAGLTHISHTGILGDADTEGVYDNIDTVTWKFEDVAPGASGFVTITAVVATGATGLLKNIAELEWTGGDTEKPEVTIPVGSYKTVADSSEAGAGGKPVRPGDLITFTIHYLNSTGSNADVTITDALPAGLAYVSHTGVPGADGVFDGDRTVVWEIEGVPGSGKGSVSITARVTEDAPGIIKNEAKLTWSHTTVDEEVEAEVPVESFKTVDTNSDTGKNGQALEIGKVLTYRIVYANKSNAAASLEITDVLPKGLEWENVPDNGSYDATNRTVTWIINGIGAGESGSVTLKVKVTGNGSSHITNKARLVWSYGSTEEPEITLPVKSHKILDGVAESVQPGDILSFKIGYYNDNGADRTLTIKDYLPDESGLEYISSSDKGDYDPVTKTVTWDMGVIGAHTGGYVTITLKVAENPGSEVKNKAGLLWGGGEVEEPEVTIPVRSYKLVPGYSEAGAGGAPVKLGDIITYEIGYINRTGTDGVTLTITDVLPQGIKYVDHSGDGAQPYSGSGPVTWIISGVDNGDSGVVTLTVKLDEILSATIVNTALLDWSVGGDEVVETENPVNSRKVITNGLGENGTMVAIGDTFIYTIWYVNNKDYARELTIRDKLPQELKYISQSPTPGAGEGYREDHHDVTWNIGSVGPNTSGSVTITVEVISAHAPTIKNQAELLWGDGIDKPETENPVAPLTVTYDANGGNGFHTVSDIPGGSIHTVLSQTATKISRSGYTFTGWNLKEDGSGEAYRPGDKLTVTTDVTLYAQWKEGGGKDPGVVVPGKTYTVTYDANGGIGHHVIGGFTYGSKHTVLSNDDVGISWLGHDFICWSTTPDLSGDIYHKGDVLTITADVILYAQWSNGALLDKKNHFAYIIGYVDNTVRPEANITRAEAATIFFRLLTEESREQLWSKTNDYGDVKPDEWFNNAISTLSNGGILKGYPDGNFYPHLSISRAEFAVLAVAFEGGSRHTASIAGFSDIDGHWAEKSIRLAAELGYVKGYTDGTFKPDQPIARAEVAALINAVLDRHVSSPENLLSGMKSWPDCIPGKWYYLDMQEATSSHYYELNPDNPEEKWTSLRETPNWSLLEKPYSNPGDVKI